MSRVGGYALVLLASAAIALGSPLCCLLGIARCGTGTTVPAPAPEDACCSDCRSHGDARPAPKPCDDQDCACKNDFAFHAPTAEHAPLVATFEVPAVALPESTAVHVAVCFARTLSLLPACPSHPLLL